MNGSRREAHTARLRRSFIRPGLGRCTAVRAVSRSGTLPGCSTLIDWRRTGLSSSGLPLVAGGDERSGSNVSRKSLADWPRTGAAGPGRRTEAGAGAPPGLNLADAHQAVV